MPVDNDALHQIADLAGGQFFTATSESELRQVYTHLGEQIGYETRLVDQTRSWLAGATVLMVLGLGSGISIGRRIP